MTDTNAHRPDAAASGIATPGNIAPDNITTDKGVIGLGLIVAGFGFYLTLAGFGLAPEPGFVRAPGFIVVCAGLAAFGGGGAIALRGLAGIVDNRAEWPADAPRGLIALSAAGAVIAFAPLAGIATWIALGAEPHELAGSAAMLFGPLGDTAGRAVFGVGAVIAWAALAGIVHVSAKKLRTRPVRGTRRS